MKHSERYSFIQNLIEKNSAGRLEASKADAEEEKNLATSSEIDESILDEEQKDSFVNPALVEKMDSSRPQREREEDAILTKREMESLSKELGRPISFLGVKRSEEKEGSFEFSLTKEEMDETLAWAEKQAAS